MELRRLDVRGARDDGGSRVGAPARCSGRRRRGNPATRILDRIAAWAKRLTRFEPTSELMRLNAAGAASVRVGPTLTAVLDWARELEGRTDGRIDVAMLDARLSG